MKILIVSFFDDNFGDNLIRICFENLLKTVIKNLDIPADNVNIRKMPLKQIDSDLVCNSEIIFFAGGGLFGLSYLNFFDFIDEILTLAEKNNIPVIFSSIGINNMDADEENENRLTEILKNKSIKSISVRENIELFQYYSPDRNFDIVQVCDPAVWTKYVYSQNIRRVKENNPPHKRKLIGINVVRGGLFVDNKKKWYLGNEISYLNELKNLLDINGYDYKFYTNGSFLDNNTLRYYAKEYDIPESCLAYPNCTKDLVETIAEFDYVVAIRMHSSIISYALDIPSVNLVWNDKIPFFYENIGYSDRAIPLEDWNADKVLSYIKEFEKDDKYKISPDYLMTLYNYLYKCLSEFTGKSAENVFDFKRVAAELEEQIVSVDEDLADIRLKLIKGEKNYLSRFIEVRKNNQEIKVLNKEISTRNKDIENLKKGIKKSDSEIKELKSKIKSKDKEISKLKKEIDRINNLPVIRFLRKVKRVLNKIKFWQH